MATPTNRFLNKIIGKHGYIPTILGTRSSKMKSIADNLAAATEEGIKGISPQAHARARKMADLEAAKTLRTRVKTGVGLAAVGTTGFLGVHKYHQHQDNKILEKIQNGYKPPKQ